MLLSMEAGKPVEGTVDYHLHTVRCGHAVGRLQDYVLRAEALGLVEIGFSDHFPLLHLEDPSLSMSLEELPEYVREIGDLAARTAGLTVRLGIEVDYLEGYENRLAELLRPHPFDYVMGSVHYLDGWWFDDPRYLDGYRGRDILALWERYFQVLGDAAECGLFDVLAHPDLIKKFGFRPQADVRRMYENCLDRVAESGLVVEVSTAGLRKPVREIYPGLEFLRLCREREIPVTLGSDAHAPGEVGWRFPGAVAMMHRAGYREIVLFHKRERSFLPLPAAKNGL